MREEGPAKLRAGKVSAADLDGPDAGSVPVLIVMSDNGPQRRSHSTRKFMAPAPSCASSGHGHSDRQGLFETLFGQVKASGRT